MIPENGTILISRPDRIGDAVIASSCFHSIQKRYPKSKIYFLAQKNVQLLFENSPSLAGFISLPNDKISFTKIFQKIRPDAIVHFHPHKECYAASYESEIPMRIGWKHSTWDRWLTHALFDFRKEGEKHEGFYHFDLLKFLDISAPEILRGEISPSAEAQESLKKKLPRSFKFEEAVVLNPTTARDIRQWPTERFAELAKWIASESKYKIISIGADEKHTAMREFQNQTDGVDVIRLEGKLNLAELAWLLERSKVLVTCDTGPSHLAAAMNGAQVTIFGRGESAYGPVRWRALSDKAEILTPSIQKHFWETRRRFWRRGFESITLEKVKQSLKKFL